MAQRQIVIDGFSTFLVRTAFYVLTRRKPKSPAAHSDCGAFFCCGQTIYLYEFRTTSQRWWWLYRMVTPMQEVTPKVVAMAVITAATTCSTVRQTVSLFMA